MISFWKGTVFETLPICFFFFAPVNNNGFFDWFAHRPVDHVVFVKIGDRLLIEFALVSVRPDMRDKLNEQRFVNAVANDVFVWPSGRIGLSKRPLLPGHKSPEVTRKLYHLISARRSLGFGGSASSADAIALR